MDDEIRHDEQARRFEARFPEGTATLAYAPAGEGVINMYTTYVPPALRGRGIASRLVEAAMAWARASRLRVVPSCWYVAEWMGTHPETEDLLAG